MRLLDVSPSFALQVAVVYAISHILFLCQKKQRTVKQRKVGPSIREGPDNDSIIPESGEEKKKEKDKSGSKDKKSSGVKDKKGKKKSARKKSSEKADKKEEKKAEDKKAEDNKVAKNEGEVLESPKLAEKEKPSPSEGAVKKVEVEGTQRNEVEPPEEMGKSPEPSPTQDSN
uniref:Protein PXR1-like n=1 Tax=Haemonchus contortus TaxID=6289 RepID=A0A7I4XWM8_HAECO